jgi:4,5-dihydroxyphthalate decarboxylase
MNRSVSELARCAADLSPSWKNSGLEANEKMISDFATELFEQKIMARVLTPNELFPRHANSRAAVRAISPN